MHRVSTGGDATPDDPAAAAPGPAVSATPPETGTARICSRLQDLGPALSGAAPLAASGTGKSHAQLFDGSDATDRFAGRILDVHDGKPVRCSTDKNRAAYVKRFPDGTIAYSAKMAVDADVSRVIGGSGYPTT